MTHSEERATELARLPAENDRLRADSDQEGRSTGRMRSAIVWALIAVGSLAAVTAALGVWARTTALDTETYVDTVTSLPQNPAVSAALAHAVVDEMFEEASVEQQLEQALPEEIGFLAAPVGRAVRDLSVDLAAGIIASDAFIDKWEDLNRIAHTAAVGVLTGRGGALVTREGEVTLNLNDAVTTVRSGLEEAGLGDLLPAPREERAMVVLFTGSQLGLLQTFVDVLDMAYWGLPIVTMLAFAAALWVSRDRRRSWLGIGVGLAIAMATSLLFLELARGAVIDGIKDPMAQAGITATWDELFANLTRLQVALLVLALIILATAFLFGSSRWAVSFRKGVGRRIEAWRTHDPALAVQGDSLGRFLDEHVGGVRLSGIVVALLLLFAWPRLTAGIVLATATGLIVFLGLVEVARSHGPSATPPDDIKTIELTGVESETSEEAQAAPSQPD